MEASVSNQHDQLEQQLKTALEGLDIPSPDEDQKRRTIVMAREAFQAELAATGKAKQQPVKGLQRWLRLIVGTKANIGRDSMIVRQKLLYSAIGATCLVAVVAGIGLQTRIAPTSLPGRDEAIAYAPAETRLQDYAEKGYSGAAEQSSRNTGRVDMPSALPAVGIQAFGAMPSPSPALADRRAVSKMTSDLAERDVLPGTPYYEEVGRDQFEAFEQNTVKLVAEQPVSTFSVDVDTASYSFVRRMLSSGVLPPGDAVRPEEMINYFDYDYPLPESREQPFQATVTLSDAPWADGRRLLHVGIRGFDVAPSERPRSNLVFLLDVSGSMNSPDKLPLVKQSMELLLTTLSPEDTVAIAVYAGGAGTVLEPTAVKDKQKILNAMNGLSAGGSTAGGQGIRLAYELAKNQFDPKAINRVILATDGDFNVGITDQRELKSFIERERENGIFLSVLGFGQGNYRDAMMQTLAQNGNGTAAYIDTLSEAQKVLVDEATSTLFPIAKDVKIQVEFNPALVAEYRLIGYETRRLNREDFNNDDVDAGDIGAGHTVTAIYEITPVASNARQIEDLRFAPTPQSLGAADEYAFLKIRYKLPTEDSSRLISRPVTRADGIEPARQGIAEREAGFATAVAGFAQILKGGRYTADYSYDDVIELAQKTKGQDRYGYRTEFIQLVRKAKTAAAMGSQ
jgi:Ca-activated chloride channel family protein